MGDTQPLVSVIADLVLEYPADGSPKELARRVAGRDLKAAKTARQKQHENG